ADQLAIALHKNHLDEQIQAHTRQLEARVTERTEQLRTAKERTEAILMSASDAMIVASLDGSIEQVNTAFMALFGYTLEQGRALPLFSLLDAVSADTVRRTLDEIGAGGQAQRLELVGLRQDGTLFEAEAAFSRVEDGYSTTLICSLRDITTRKRAEQDLRTALAKEKELNELKSRFVSMVAHDFRSPLASIQSSSDLLNNYGDRMIAEKKQHHFKRISSQIKNLTGILEDTLTISKTEAIGVSLHPLSTDFVPFCQAIIDDMQLIDATRPIRFTVNGEVGKVEIDRDQLRRVLVNLLSNAAKYSPEGSAIEFNVQSGNEQVILRIQDEGIGIPEADQSHLFEVFHRAGNVGDIPGTGLGLVIVKRAVEAHGGSITVESQVDLGTTFILALPVTQAKSTRHE
ncbi:MAG: PAS domain-containing sensor histidine kinase, partial [Chloroflexota bacterium]